MSFQTDLETIKAAPWSQSASRIMAERTARAVAPDLAGRPFYPVLRSSLPPGLAGCLVGCSGPVLDLQLRRFIRDWSGRGVAVWIDDGDWLMADAAIPGWSLSLPSPLDRVRQHRLNQVAAATREEWLLKSLAHELAHVLSRPIHVAELSSDHEAALAAAFEPAVKAIAAAPDGDAIELSHHDMAWVRTLCHLRRRVERLGFELAGEDLTRYGLSPLAEYAAALGDEPARLAGESFAAIRTTPIPTPFLKLYAADVARRSDSH